MYAQTQSTTSSDVEVLHSAFRGQAEAAPRWLTVAGCRVEGVNVHRDKFLRSVHVAHGGFNLRCLQKSRAFKGIKKQNNNLS